MSKETDLSTNTLDSGYDSQPQPQGATKDQLPSISEKPKCSIEEQEIPSNVELVVNHNLGANMPSSGQAMLNVDQDKEMLEKQLQDTHGRCDQLESDKIDLQAKVSELEKKLKAANNEEEASKLKSLLSRAQKKVSILNNELRNASESKVRLNAKILALEKENKKLEERLQTQLSTSRNTATFKYVSLLGEVLDFKSDCPIECEIALTKEKNFGKGSYAYVTRITFINKETDQTDSANPAIFAAKVHLDRGDDDDYPEEKYLEYEKECLMNCQHQNVIKYYGCLNLTNKVSHDTVPRDVLIMEKMDATFYEYYTQELTTDDPLYILKVCDVLFQVAKGLEYLHSPLEFREGNLEYIIHRDLNAKNVLLLYQGDDKFPLAKISDFGVSRPVHSYDNSFSYKQWKAGYRDPEMDRSKNYTTAVDVFSFGHMMLLSANKEKSVALSGVENVTPDWERRIKLFHNLSDHIKDKVVNEAFFTLALSCFCRDIKERPKAAQLKNEVLDIVSNLLRTHELSTLVSNLCLHDKHSC